MAAIQFPANPQPAQAFTLPDGRRWVYVEKAWRLVSSIQSGMPLNLNLDRYDLAVGRTLTTDLDEKQVVAYDNTTTGTKQVILNDAPAGRAMTVILEITGNVGTVTLPANVVFAQGVDNSLGATKTIFVLFWNGSGFTVTSNIKV